MTDLTLLAIDWQLSNGAREPHRSELIERRAAHVKQQEHYMNAQAPDISTRIAQFVALRQKIDEIETRHEQELKPYKDARAQLEAVLLSMLDAAGVDNAASKGVGTVYRSTRKSTSLADPDAFRRFVIGGELWHLLDWKANVTAVEAFLDENKALPPGVNFSQKLTVGVRKA